LPLRYGDHLHGGVEDQRTAVTSGETTKKRELSFLCRSLMFV
jgi:hypothetical protein